MKKKHYSITKPKKTFFAKTQRGAKYPTLPDIVDTNNPKQILVTCHSQREKKFIVNSLIKDFIEYRR